MLERQSCATVSAFHDDLHLYNTSTNYIIETAIPPTFGIKYFGSKSVGRSPYVVAMVDLDAPTPQNRSLADVRHFLGGNFYLGYPGLDSTALLSNKTPAISEFQQPSPPAGSAPHR